METELIWKYLNATANKREVEKVQKWLADDPDGSHAEQFFEIHALYDGITLFSETPVSAKTRRSSVMPFVKYAAAASLAALFIVGVGTFSLKRAERRMMANNETISVPAGKTMQLTLEDGSELWLNSGTQVERPLMFAKRHRTIKVNNGEILIDVAKDSKRPFHVKTPKADIKVLGTRFDVSVENEGFQTTLLRGSVSISPENGEEIILKPFEKAVLEQNGSFAISRISDAVSVENWTNGIIELVGVPFDELMRKFEKAFDTTIIIKLETLPEIKLARGRVRVIDGVEHALKVLKIGADFQYSIDYSTNTITIY